MILRSFKKTLARRMYVGRDLPERHTMVPIISVNYQGFPYPLQISSFTAPTTDIPNSRPSVATQTSNKDSSIKSTANFSLKGNPHRSISALARLSSVILSDNKFRLANQLKLRLALLQQHIRRTMLNLIYNLRSSVGV